MGEVTRAESVHSTGSTRGRGSSYSWAVRGKSRAQEVGEPLNFVAGGERLFKNYLRELLVVFCMRGRASSSRRALRMAVDYLSR